MYSTMSALPVEIDAVDLTRNEREVSSDFTRVTTTIRLSGGGHTGKGEDVTYDEVDHERLVDEPPSIPVPFGDTFGAFCDRLDGCTIFPRGPERSSSRNYRRWGIESAALDLALRQAQVDVASVLRRRFDPVRFVVSTRLGEPPTIDRVDTLLERYPSTELKLDPTEDWSSALISALADTGRVRILDLKGAYEGTDVDQGPAPELYRRAIEAFPEAIIEDPAITPETEPILAAAADRISWDAPITDVGDLETQPFDPAWLNVKPSRFGTVQSVLETIDYCRDHGIGMYGGGQFELDVGRLQIQALASLFYADSPNDVAPGRYNDAAVRSGLPTSPLRPPRSARGFTFE